jgi:hypothetical protein
MQLRLLMLFNTFRVHQISYHARRSTIACLPRHGHAETRQIRSYTLSNRFFARMVIPTHASIIASSETIVGG